MLLEALPLDDGVSRLLNKRLGVKTLNDVEPSYVRNMEIGIDLP